MATGKDNVQAVDMDSQLLEAAKLAIKHERGDLEKIVAYPPEGIVKAFATLAGKPEAVDAAAISKVLVTNRDWLNSPESPVAINEMGKDNSNALIGFSAATFSDANVKQAIDGLNKEFGRPVARLATGADFQSGAIPEGGRWAVVGDEALFYMKMKETLRNGHDLLEAAPVLKDIIHGNSSLTSDQVDNLTKTAKTLGYDIQVTGGPGEPAQMITFSGRDNNMRDAAIVLDPSLQTIGAGTSYVVTKQGLVPEGKPDPKILEGLLAKAGIERDAVHQSMRYVPDEVFATFGNKTPDATPRVQDNGKGAPVPNH